MHGYCTLKLTKTPSSCHLIISSQLHVIIVSLYPNIMTSSRLCLILTFSRPYPYVLFLVFAHPHILPFSFSHRHVLDVMSTHALSPIFIFSYPCISISSPPHHHDLTSSHSDPHIFTSLCPSQPGSRRASFGKRCRIP